MDFCVGGFGILAWLKSCKVGVIWCEVWYSQLVTWDIFSWEDNDYVKIIQKGSSWRKNQGKKEYIFYKNVYNAEKGEAGVKTSKVYVLNK